MNKKEILKQIKNQKITRIRAGFFLNEDLLKEFKTKCDKLEVSQSVLLEIIMKDFLSLK